MAHSDFDLAALISSRICHDLISPIGAINNGLELLGITGMATDGPEMSLIAESVANASARIRFFRIAFGAASENEVGRAEVVSALDDMFGAGRLSVEWGPLEAQPRSQVRLAFLAIQCLESAMPFGGRIEVSLSHQQWKIHGTAEKFNEIDALWSILRSQGDASALGAANVQFAILPSAIKQQNRDLRVEMSPTDIKIAF